MNNNIKDFSTEELENELKRRIAKKFNPPSMNLNPQWASLIHLVQSMLGESLLIDPPRWNEDNKQYIFERVMEVLYGNNFFNWFNEVFD